MKLIEKEIVIATDGKLPPDFREAFGRKARVAVYLQEQEQGENRSRRFPIGPRRQDSGVPQD